MLALASEHLRRHPEWSLPLIAIVTERLLEEAGKKKPVSALLERFLATKDVDDDALDALDGEITSLRTHWGERLRRARDKRLSEGKLSEALTTCDKLSKHGLSNRGDILTSAHILAHAGQLKDAILLTDSVSDRDQDCELQRFRASIFERLGRFHDALNAAQNAVDLSKNNGEVRADLGRILAKRRDQLMTVRGSAPDTQDGLVAAVELVRIDCSSSNIAALAHIQARHGILDEALASVDRVIVLDAANGEHFRLKASLLERMGRLEEAQIVAAKAAELLPHQMEVEEDYRRISAARRDELIRARDDNFPNVVSLEAAKCLDRLGDSTIADIAKFAHIQTHHGLLEQALITIERAIQRDAGDSEFFRLKGSLLERLGMFEAGLAGIKQALKLAPNDKSLKADKRRLRAKVICSRIMRG
ncbi:hypothetical protein D9X30_3971 [Cupriavidus sp. U2]|nr:hypothetical protein D9X30_3971 [Cupriavidus sp. U2]